MSAEPKQISTKSRVCESSFNPVILNHVLSSTLPHPILVWYISSMCCSVDLIVLLIFHQNNLSSRHLVCLHLCWQRSFGFPFHHCRRHLWWATYCWLCELFLANNDAIKIRIFEFIIPDPTEVPISETSFKSIPVIWSMFKTSGWQNNLNFFWCTKKNHEWNWRHPFRSSRIDTTWYGDTSSCLGFCWTHECSWPFIIVNTSFCRWHRQNTNHLEWDLIRSLFGWSIIW